jgi:hypothetical protein
MKKFKKIAAVFGAGLLMGTTMGMAADLGDLPAPFVTGGAYTSTAFVVGAKAGTNDDGARTTLTGYFNPHINAEVGGIVASSDTEKLYFGENITNEFTTNLSDGHISSLWDDGISFRGDNYETHEEIVTDGPNEVYLVTSAATGEEELGLDLAMYTIGGSSWGYRYVFDETFQADDNLSTDYELTVDFLGNPIRISSSTASTNTIAITTGIETSGGQDTSIAYGAHTIHVGTIFETKAEIWVDDSAHEFMGETDVETFEVGGAEIDVRLDDIGYTDDTTSRTVLFTYGTDISTSVKHNDAVQTELGQPDVDDTAADALWNWDIQIATDDYPTSGDYIGIVFNQKVSRWDDDPVPLMDGDGWASPYGYLTLDMEVVEQTYNEYKFDFESSVEINSTSDTDTQDVMYITAVGKASEDEGITFAATETSRVAINETGYVWYVDTDGDFQPIGYANGTSCGTTALDALCIKSGDTTKSIVFYQNATALVGGGELGTAAQRFRLEDVESGDSTSLNVDPTYTRVNLTIGDQKLGGTLGDADAADLVYYSTITGALVAKSIYAFDEPNGGNAMTLAGLQFTNVESNLDSDELVVMVPEEEPYVEVTFNVRSIGAAADPVLTTDSGASSYTNLILVGGPCVNTLTAEYMGLPADSCEAASTIAENSAIIKLVSGDTKTALIVAGWEKADTARAATTVAAGGLTGMEMTA